MDDKLRVIPIDLDGKYIIEIPEDSKVDLAVIVTQIDEWIGSDDTFLIIGGGLKLTKVD